MDVVVTGIGLSSALGCLEATWQRLLNGQSAIRLHQPFPELPEKPIALIGQQPSELIALTDKVVEAALEDAELVAPLPDCGVSIGSSRGHQSQWERLASKFSTSQLSESEAAQWLELLPQGAAIAAARQIGTMGPVLSPMAACATGLWAIAQGVQLIQSGRCQRVLAGAVEAPITPLTLTGFQQMGALAQSGAYPFDCDREGLVLGEGGAVLVLESATLAHARGARCYGRVLGFGLTADSYHVSAPEPQRQAAITAVHDCLRRSGISPAEVGYIHAHGTATRLNDRNEAHLLQHLFPWNVPLSSTKGATGHTIGASGALGAAVCLLSLHRHYVPPCVGLSRPEFDLNLVRTADSIPVQTALCLSFGFGGQNAAIAFEATINGED